MLSGILAEIGDIHQFDSHKQLAKFAGLAWTEYQSGNFTANHSRLIRSGNRFLRYYLMEAANSVRLCRTIEWDYEQERPYNLDSRLLITRRAELE